MPDYRRSRMGSPARSSVSIEKAMNSMSSSTHRDGGGARGRFRQRSERGSDEARKSVKINRRLSAVAAITCRRSKVERGAGRARRCGSSVPRVRELSPWAGGASARSTVPPTSEPVERRAPTSRGASVSRISSNSRNTFAVKVGSTAPVRSSNGLGGPRRVCGARLRCAFRWSSSIFPTRRRAVTFLVVASTSCNRRRVATANDGRGARPRCASRCSSRRHPTLDGTSSRRTMSGADDFDARPVGHCVDIRYSTVRRHGARPRSRRATSMRVPWWSRRRLVLEGARHGARPRPRSATSMGVPWSSRGHPYSTAPPRRTMAVERDFECASLGGRADVSCSTAPPRRTTSMIHHPAGALRVPDFAGRMGSGLAGSRENGLAAEGCRHPNSTTAPACAWHPRTRFRRATGSSI